MSLQRAPVRTRHRRALGAAHGGLFFASTRGVKIPAEYAAFAPHRRGGLRCGSCRATSWRAASSFAI